ncbi:hypothetical protein BCF33_1104 [Hasllibacter halocynthiae]|uniref:Lipoprotein n=1 Tax=Hasllibacter halocynthiae TaxID=595589 RepID=A0A2T0X981_9RHOB|nr:DUF6778 family protein [Hasllibacter halocynthiae]PRY95483.1 hypothetical protein BCF33_1104 [Hasllibacter halocynthiae]
MSVRLLRASMVALCLVSTAACAPGGRMTAPAEGEAPARAAASLAGFSVAVPEALRVSDSEGYYPGADIVWHGDPYGDRRAQVAALFEEAAATAERLAGPEGRPVLAEVSVVRFHGLSPRARLTVGGVHNMIYDLTLRDAATGAVLETRRVDASIRGHGGLTALRAEERGRTQRVRVIDALARSLVGELARGVAPPPA